MEQKVALNFTPYIILRENDTHKKALASRLLENISEFETITDADAQSVKLEKIAKAQLLIKQFSVLEAVKQGLEDSVTASSGLLLYDDIMGYSSIDSDGVTLYKIYNNDVSADGIKNINKNILSKDYKDVYELLDALRKNIVVFAIKNSKTNGTGHISSVLTKENADSVDIDITNYLNTQNKTDINKTILNSSFNDVEDLENVIKNYKPSSSTGATGTGGSTGGSSDSSSSSGNSKPLVMTDASALIGENNNSNNTENNAVFTDLTSSHWAYNEVMELYKKGIVSGKDDNKFSPDDSLTRAELVKMICMAKNIQPEYFELGFDDVNADDWYAPYVAAAFKNGWINGIDEKTFAPNEKVTRQDICTIIYRAGGFEKSESSDLSDFDTVSEYAKEPVAALNNAGIISGFEDNTFRPFDFCTRAQAAVIIYRYTK